MPKRGARPNVEELLRREARQLASDMRDLRALRAQLAARRQEVMYRLSSTYHIPYREIAELFGLTIPRVGQLVTARRNVEREREREEYERGRSEKA